MADGDETRDRIRSAIIRSSSFDTEIEQSLQAIKETSSEEEEVATTPAVAGAGDETGVGAEDQIIVEAGVGAEADIVIGLEEEVEATPVEVTGGGTSDELVNELFRDFTARRAGVINALTSDFETFYKRCDPAVKDELCLYGLPDQSWNVRWPTDLPPEVPKPNLGINHLRDSMLDGTWRLLVANQSDKWLTDMICFEEDLRGLDTNSRLKLEDKTKGLEKVHDAVKNHANQQTTSKRSPREVGSPAGSPREAGSPAGGSKRARRMK